MLLERFCYGPPGVGTFGRFTAGKFTCWTVEREWAANQAFVSCVPEGVYHLEPFVSPRWGHTYALTQDAGRITITQQTSSRRWACLFHPANRAAELQGCIAPGDALGLVKAQWAVKNSNTAFNALLRAIAATGERLLEIRPRPGAALTPTDPSVTTGVTT